MLKTGLIDEITIQRILDSSRIDEVITDFVNLKKRGSNFTGLCPFHNEKTPSFSVSPVKGIYKCFGCGKAGNVVNFLMEHEKMSYPDALRWLAKKYNIEIVEKEITPEELIKRDERESLYAAISFAHTHFMNMLHKSEEGKAVGLAYFRERGFREDTIRKFELGYSSEKNDIFYNDALKNGFKIEILQKAGLINKANHDAFSGRVIFPLHNLSGKVVGFTGRILKNEKSSVKYYNSPESEIFHKGSLLFGLFHAKKYIADKNKCYLVEGNTDVLSMHQSGVENCVASSGTALTVEQISLVKRFTKNLTLLYDSDIAGVKAALRGIDLLLSEGMQVKVILLPENEDPDSIARKLSPTELLEYLEKEEKDFFAFKTTVLLKDAARDPVKYTEVLNEIIKTLALVPDNILRSLYIKDCSKLLDVEEQLLHSEVAKKIIMKRADSRPSFNARLLPASTQHTPQLTTYPVDFFAEEQEKEILRLLFKYGNDDVTIIYNNNGTKKKIDTQVAPFIINELINDDLELRNLIYRKVFLTLSNQINLYRRIEINEFVYNQDVNIYELTASLLSIPYYSAKVKGQSDLLSKYYKRIGIDVKSEDKILGNAVMDVILRYKIKVIQIARSDFSEKLKMAQESDLPETVSSLLEEIRNLDNCLIDLNNMLGQVII